MGKKNFGVAVAAAKETIEQRTREEVTPVKKKMVMYKQDCIRKSFLMLKHLELEFNKAAADLDVDKGVLMNMIVEEWLQKRKKEM